MPSNDDRIQRRVSDDQIGQILDILSSRQREFGDRHAKTLAETTSSTQGELHRRFVAYAAQVIDIANVELQDEINKLSQSVRDRLGKLGIFNVIQNVGSYIVSGLPFTIFTEDDLAGFFASMYDMNYEYCYEYSLVIIAAYFGYNFELRSLVTSSEYPVLSIGFPYAAARIEFVQASRDASGKASDDVTVHDARLGQIATQIEDREKQVASIDKNISALQIRNESNEKKAEEFLQKVSELEGKQDTLIVVLEEKYKLKEERKLWSDAAFWSSINFYISALVIIFSMCCLVLLPLYYSTEVVAFIMRIESSLMVTAGGEAAGAITADPIAVTFTAIGRLVLITAPLGFAIWLIRFLARYNLRSMLLMDDARQRVTMLNTYLFLIEQDGALKQDRGAILEALFRRAPGHGNDAPEPPHFTDLLRYGQDTVKQ